MSFLKTTFISCLLLLCMSSFAQYEKLLNQARRYYDRSLLFEAKACYAKILEKDSTNKLANLEMAELLFFDIEDFGGAAVYLERYLRAERDTSSPFIYALGKCANYNGNFAGAKKYFMRFSEKIKDEGKDAQYREEVQKQLLNLNYRKEHAAAEMQEHVKVVNLGKNVNTPYPEYVPVVNENENVLMFTSKRKNALNTSPDDKNERYREDMYIAKKNGPNFGSPDVLPALDKETQQLKNSPRNESLISLSPDGKTLFLFKKGSIYSSEFKDGVWGEPKVLDEKIISEAYENHASVTADGKTIFFTSERKGGEGGLDIYRAEKRSDGSWNKPVNLGKEINTAADEESPYITPDGKTLFFSSSGHPGYGGHDIYRADWDGNKFGKARNMGQPFNSAADDIFFYPHKDLSEGFLSSNRKGGIGDFDIYRFYYTDKPVFDIHPGQALAPELQAALNKLLKGFENDSARTDQLLAGLTHDPRVSGVYFRLNDSLVSEDPQVISANMNKDKEQVVQVEVMKRCDTCIYNQSFVTSVTVYPKSIASAGKPLVTTGTAPVLESLSPVYFDYTKFDLRDDAKTALDKDIADLKNAPAAFVTIYGYTDSRGPEALNRRLALQRAQQVKKYLVANGIPAKRIKAVISKGEESSCTGNCTEQEHQQNRRVEIRPSTAP